ncbi:MAG: metallophosphoesterase family protein [Candidatus Ornithospirochaeta sp.]
MEKIWEAKEKVGASSLLSLGDLCPEPYCPIWRNISGVRGNCDRFFEYGDLPFPPLERELFLFGHRLLIFHGHSMPSFSFKEGDIVLSGHTHIPKAEERNGIYYFNPGSASLPRSSSGPSFGVLEERGFSVFSLLDFRKILALSISSSQ